MPRDYLKILKDQREELTQFFNCQFLKRKQIAKIDINSALAQAVIGMRRAGKSVLCRLALQNAGVSFGYVNFDDEALGKITSDDLNDVLENVYTVYGTVEHLLFDEIQNVDGWQLFVNRLLRAGKHVVITGSNAKLLTDDLATHLTGRYLPIEVMPFSFSEYRAWLQHENTGTTAAAAEYHRDWEHYFFNGGLPETFSLTEVRGYVAALYNSIIFRDILQRHKVRNPGRFADAAYVIMQQFAREISVQNLAQKANVASVHTMQTYLFFLTQAYLISTVRKYSVKPAERLRNAKVYVNDPAFISYFTGVLGSEEELGWRLENIVYLELLRRRADGDYEIFYYQDQTSDIDFCLVRHGKIIQLVQVSYTLAGEKTRRREIAPLFSAGRKLHCQNLLVITDHETETVKDGELTIEIIPAPDWIETNVLPR